MAIIQTDDNYHNRTRRVSFNIVKDRARKRVEKAGQLSEKLRLKETQNTGVPIIRFPNKSIKTPYQICQRCGRETPLTKSEFCPSCITVFFKEITRRERRSAGLGFYVLLAFAGLVGFAVIGFFLYLLP